MKVMYHVDGQMPVEVDNVASVHVYDNAGENEYVYGEELSNRTYIQFPPFEYPKAKEGEGDGE